MIFSDLIVMKVSQGVASNQFTDKKNKYPEIRHFFNKS